VITLAYRTVVGRREMNEDQVAEIHAGAYRAIVVSDGMGGHQAGDVASRMVIEGVRELVGRLPEDDPAPALAEGLRRISREIFQASREVPGREDMGATVVLALTDGARLWIAHVGDSRAYRAADGFVSRLTEDHTAVQEAVNRGEISEEEAESSPYRNALLHCMGHDEDPEPCVLGPEPLQDGQIILLCSDGLSGAVRDGEMLRVLQGTTALAAAAEYLVRLAYRQGSSDNITVALLEKGRAWRSGESLPPLPPAGGKAWLRRLIALAQSRQALGAAAILLIALLAGLGGVLWMLWPAGASEPELTRLHRNAEPAPSVISDRPGKAADLSAQIEKKRSAAEPQSSRTTEGRSQLPGATEPQSTIKPAQPPPSEAKSTEPPQVPENQANDSERKQERWNAINQILVEADKLLKGGNFTAADRQCKRITAEHQISDFPDLVHWRNKIHDDLKLAGTLTKRLDEAERLLNQGKHEEADRICRRDKAQISRFKVLQKRRDEIVKQVELARKPKTTAGQGSAMAQGGTKPVHSQENSKLGNNTANPAENRPPIPASVAENSSNRLATGSDGDTKSDDPLFAGVYPSDSSTEKKSVPPSDPPMSNIVYSKTTLAKNANSSQPKFKTEISSRLLPNHSRPSVEYNFDLNEAGQITRFEYVRNVRFPEYSPALDSQFRSILVCLKPAMVNGKPVRYTGTLVISSIRERANTCFITEK